jgi:hypothetical protein
MKSRLNGAIWFIVSNHGVLKPKKIADFCDSNV